MNKLYRYTWYDATVNLYIGGNGLGSMALSATPIYFYFDPQDWKETKASIGRNIEKGGVFRKDASPIKFTKDAAHVLRYYFYTYHTSRTLTLIIDKQIRNDANTLEYERYFSADVDFGQGIDAPDDGNDVFFSVRLIELGLHAIIESHEETTYEIPFDADALDVRFPGIELRSSYNYVPIAGNVLATHGGGAMAFACTAGAWYDTEGDYEVGSTHDPEQSTTFVVVGINLSQSVFDQLYLFEANQSMIFDFHIAQEYTLQWQGGGGTTSRFQVTIVVADSNRDIQNVTNVYISSLNTSGTLISNLVIDETVTGISLNAGDRVFLFVESFGGTGANIDVTYFGNPSTALPYTHSVLPTFTLAPTNCKAFRYIDAINKMVMQMANTTAISDYLSQPSLKTLDNCPWNTLITSTDAIRNLPDAVLKINLSDVLKDIKRWCIGMGVEGSDMRFEPLWRYYDKTSVAYTASVSGRVKVSLATDLMYNRYKVGYPDNTRDELNGRYEFNCQHEYTTDLLSPGIQNELNLVSPFHAGQYYIENVRSFLFRKNTTSAQEDNSVVLIEVDTTTVTVGSTAYYIPKLSPNNSGTLFPATDYNEGLSPKRTLIRNLMHIGSYLPNGSRVKFQTSSRNKDLISGDNLSQMTKKVIESSDLVITATGATAPGVSGTYLFNKLFKPYYFEAELTPPENLLEYPVTELYKLFGVIHSNGTQYNGFLMDLGNELATNNVYSAKFLCGPDQNLTGLING